jgi:transcriptional regulator with XRE-family HTH domain
MVSATTNALGRWLRRELERRELTQIVVAVNARVAPATLSEILNRGHVPKVETLFRLADFFGTSREDVLRLAGHLPPSTIGGEAATELGGADEALVRELLEEFRRVPDEWKPVAIEQMAQFRRLAELRPVHFVGEEEGESGSRGARAQGARVTAQGGEDEGE